MHQVTSVSRNVADLGGGKLVGWRRGRVASSEADQLIGKAKRSLFDLKPHLITGRYITSTRTARGASKLLVGVRA